MGDIMNLIQYFPSVGRFLVIICGVFFIIVGIEEIAFEKRKKAIIISLLGVTLIVLEVLVPIAAINTVIAGFFFVCLVLFLATIICA